MSIISAVKIANMALSHLGTRSSIEDFSENSTEAKAAKLWYDDSRIMALEHSDWTFARKRQALALDSDDPPEGIWTYRYQYPADCLKARRIEWSITADLPAFHIELSNNGERKTILTDIAEAKLIYTANITNPMLFSRGFILAFSFALAHNMAFSLTGRSNIKELMLVEFNRAAQAAAAEDANEEMQRAPRDTDWIRGRL